VILSGRQFDVTFTIAQRKHADIDMGCRIARELMGLLPQMSHKIRGGIVECDLVSTKFSLEIFEKTVTSLYC